MAKGGIEASLLAVEALQKIIRDSEIKIRVNIDFNKLWASIVSADDDDLKRSGWIVNCTPETVQFYVYNSDDLVRWVPAHKVDAQPGETVQVHGGVFQKKHENMVVYKENRGTAYNVKKNHLHFWTGSAMIEEGPTMEHFKNVHHDPRKKLANKLNKF